jgi:hypothetical protein
LQWHQGINHFCVLVFITIAIVSLGFHQKKLEQSYDEDVLTASDYSIVVTNPPNDATNPEEWKDFFSQFGKHEVVYVTVALDNDGLIQALSERRALLQQASFKRIEKTINLEQLQEISKSLAHTNKLLYKKLKRMNETCRELLQQSYPASAVFVTFQTEECQRRVLKALSVGSIYVATNDSSHIEDPNHDFRGKLVLDVEEAVEQSAIRWKDLNKSMTASLWMPT